MKANTYFKSLTKWHYPLYIYRPTELHFIQIMAIADFLKDNSLMGQAHYDVVKQDLEYMRENGVKLIDTGATHAVYIKLPKHNIRLSHPDLQMLKRAAGVQ